MLISGKHLAKNAVTTVDMKTGETKTTDAKMHLLGPKPGVCQTCATDHDEAMPHNAQSLFYQYNFYNEHGRWPTWKDALAHCTQHVRDQWKKHLATHGVTVED